MLAKTKAGRRCGAGPLCLPDVVAYLSSQNVSKRTQS